MNSSQQQTKNVSTPKSILRNIDLSYLDPSKIDWQNLKPRVMESMTKTQTIITVIVSIIVLLLVVLIIYNIVMMFQNNLLYYPVLLTSPIRGAHFTRMPSTMDQHMFPVIDRKATQYQGIKLPYGGNELSFLQEPQLMPYLNNQVQFSLNFWVRIENFSQLNKSCTINYSKLFVQDVQSSSKNNTGKGQFEVMYDVTNNELVLSVNILKHGESTDHVQSQVFRVPNVLLIQKWQMITIVLDNRDLDVYHNTKMVRSFHLDNVPHLVNNYWNLYPGKVPFVGTISCARYFDYAFDSHEVYRLYQWQRGQDVPYESYYLWWSWYKSNVLTKLYRTLRKDEHKYTFRYYRY